MPALTLVTCTACQHEFRIPTSLSGREVSCPYCSKRVQIQSTGKHEQNDPLIGKEVGGCKLLRRLGSGALGVVYEGIMLTTGRNVAVKLLASKHNDHPESVRRFQREGQLAERIDHPNVVRVLAQGFDRKVHFMVMELIEGGSLAGRIEAEGRLPWADASRIIRQLADALATVRSEGIIHRDIKPANILLTNDGMAKLADLGIGKHIEGAKDQTALTMQGVAMGTPNYMPPEQIRDSASASYPADVYALGATFYHAVTGEPPFVGESSVAIMRNVLNQPVVPPCQRVPELPQGINDLILEMLAKDPEERPADARILVTEIDRALQAPAVARVRRRRPSPPSRPSSTYTAWIIVVILLLVALVAALYFTGRFH